MKSGSRLHLYPEQTFECLECETGCCSLFSVAVTETEAREMLAAKTPGAPGSFDECFAPLPGTPGEHELKRRNGRCVFADGRLCGVHLTRGYAAKPLSCRVFPMDIRRWRDGHISVEYRFICPAVGRPGKRLGDSIQEIAILARQLENRREVDDAIFSRRVPAPLERVRMVHEGFRRLLEDGEMPLRLRLYAAARILTFHDDPAMAEAVNQATGAFDDELILFLVKAQPKLEEELAKARFSERSAVHFRNLLAGYLRDDAPQCRSVRDRFRNAWKQIRVYGNRADMTLLKPDAPELNIGRLPSIALNCRFSPEAMTLFYQFFYGKLDSMHFCGTRIHNFDYATGLRHLLLAVVATIAFAAAYAESTEKETVTETEMLAAVRLVDFTFGRSPFFRLSAARGWINRLTRPRTFAALLKGSLPETLR